MNDGFLQIKRLGAFDLGHGDHDLHGREVWSHLSEGSADPEKYFLEKYGRFDLPHEE